MSFGSLLCGVDLGFFKSFLWEQKMPGCVSSSSGFQISLKSEGESLGEFLFTKTLEPCSETDLLDNNKKSHICSLY